MDSYDFPTTKPLYRGTQIVWYLVGIIEIVLAFRFVLKLLGANTAVGFTHFVCSTTNPLAYPFYSVFGMSQVEGAVFEWTTLLAMIVYVLVVVSQNFFWLGRLSQLQKQPINFPNHPNFIQNKVVATVLWLAFSWGSNWSRDKKSFCEIIGISNGFLGSSMFY